MACGVNGTTAAIRGALTPFANCKSATARRTTRTCCTPPLNSFLNAFWSLVVTSICRAGRAIPQVCAQTFLIGVVLLESFQAWGTEQHRVCLLDREGQVVGERWTQHSGASITELI